MINSIPINIFSNQCTAFVADLILFLITLVPGSSKYTVHVHVQVIFSHQVD